MSATGTFEGTSVLVQDRFLITAIAGNPVTAGQPVSLVSSGFPPTVKPTPNANATDVLGIALTTQAVSGQVCTVVARGIARATTDGTAITAGQHLVTSSAYLGTVTPLATYTDANVSGLIVVTNSGYVGAGLAAIIQGPRGELGKAISYAAAVSGTTVYIALT